jgi:hypothetical protein
MKKITIFSTILFTVCGISCFAQKAKVCDLTKLHLNDSVKSIRKTSYQAIEVSGQVQKGNKKSESFDFDNYILFDTKGNKKEESNYNSEGGLIEKNTYKYDNSGRLIEKLNFYASGKLDNKYVYKYDDQNNQNEYTRFSSDGSEQETCIDKLDEKGNKIESSVTNFGPFNKKWVYKYDDTGKVIEETVYSKTETPDKVTRFKYDSNGNQIEKNSSSWNIFNQKKITCKYDDNGNIIEELTYDSNGNLTVKYIYIYVYDSHKNWTKQSKLKYGIQLNKIDRDESYITEREIKYY